MYASSKFEEAFCYLVKHYCGELGLVLKEVTVVFEEYCSGCTDIEYNVYLEKDSSSESVNKLSELLDMFSPWELKDGILIRKTFSIGYEDGYDSLKSQINALDNFVSRAEDICKKPIQGVSNSVKFSKAVPSCRVTLYKTGTVLKANENYSKFEVVYEDYIKVVCNNLGVTLDKIYLHISEDGYREKMCYEVIVDSSDSDLAMQLSTDLELLWVEVCDTYTVLKRFITFPAVNSIKYYSDSHKEEMYKEFNDVMSTLDSYVESVEELGYSVEGIDNKVKYCNTLPRGTELRYSKC